MRRSLTVSRRLLGYLWCTALVLCSGSVLAHHSYSMFDFKNPTTLSGTVREFQWTNPHAFIVLDVPGARDTTERYLIETQSPSMLLRTGWKYNTVKVGEKVTILMFPLRDGRKGGALYSLQLPGGQVLKSTFSADVLKSGNPEFRHP